MLLERQNYNPNPGKLQFVTHIVFFQGGSASIAKRLQSKVGFLFCFVFPCDSKLAVSLAW